MQIVRSGLASQVAITLGCLGALLVSAEAQMRLSAIEVEVRSAVGAGDSFLGAATYGLAAGKSIEEAFRHGLAAGTVAVMSPGTGLCQPADLERLLGEIRPKPASSGAPEVSCHRSPQTGSSRPARYRD